MPLPPPQVLGLEVCGTTHCLAEKKTKQPKKDRVYSGSHFKGAAHGMEVKVTELGAPGHMTSQVRSREGWMNECTVLHNFLSPLIQSRIPPREWRHLQWAGLPTCLKLTKVIKAD